MNQQEQDGTRTSFELYLRTGRWVAAHPFGRGIEVKFNPWHDPDDGRFTFKGQGIRFGAVGEGAGERDRRRAGRAKVGEARAKPGSFEARVQADDVAIKRRNEILDIDNPANHTTYSVRSGDTLAGIAAKRQGLTAGGLARLNAIREDDVLRVGQAIRLPNQAHLDAVHDARGVYVGLSHYMTTHHGQVPSGPGKLTDQLANERIPVSKNGYTFQLDGLFRSKHIQGVLANEAGKRSSRNQRKAGGMDRRPHDDGGHYIAVRFNGPSDSFNHFAQDANFNRGAYRALEDGLAGAQRAGKQVHVEIVPYYRGISQRSYRVDFKYKIDGTWREKKFSNERGGK